MWLSNRPMLVKHVCHIVYLWCYGLALNTRWHNYFEQLFSRTFNLLEIGYDFTEVLQSSSQWKKEMKNVAHFCFVLAHYVLPYFALLLTRLFCPSEDGQSHSCLFCDTFRWAINSQTLKSIFDYSFNGDIITESRKTDIFYWSNYGPQKDTTGLSLPYSFVLPNFVFKGSNIAEWSFYCLEYFANHLLGSYGGR